MHPLKQHERTTEWSLCLFKQQSGCRAAGILSSSQVPGIVNSASLRILGFLLFLKKYFCDSSFSFAYPLPLRSMESQRNMAGTGYRASLPDLLLNLKMCLVQKAVATL